MNGQAIKATVGWLLMAACALFVGTARAQDNPLGAETATEKPASGAEQSQPQLTKLPQLKNFVEAEYPATAAARGVEGEVTLALLVNEQGQVVDVAIVRRAGWGFDEAAVAAAKQFVFDPAMVGDEPVPVQITYNYRFVLKEVAETPATPQDQTIAEAASPTGQEIPASMARRHLPVNFEGRVREKGTRKPLANVEVALVELDESQMTDEEGRFAFHGLPAGRYTVKYFMVGYVVGEDDLVIRENERVRQTVYLEKLSYSDYELTVRTRRPVKEVTRRVVKQEEIKKLPGTQGDTIKVVEVLPGVARTPGGLGGMLVFRGGEDTSAAVLIDGVGIPQLFHFGGVRSVINSEIVESLDFYPGNAGAYYGQLMSGVIDLRTRDPKDDRLHGKIDVNIFEGGFLLEGPIVEDLSFMAAFHRNWHDLVLNAVWPSDSPVNFAIAPRYYDYQFKLLWKINSQHSVEAFIYGSDDRWKVVAGNDETSGRDYGSHMFFSNADLRHIWKMSEKATNTITADLLYLLEEDGFGDEGFVNINTYNLGLQDDLNLRLTSRYQLNAGAGVGGERFSADVTAPHLSKFGEEDYSIATVDSKRTFDDTVNAAWVQAYAEVVAEPADGLKLVPGVRTDFINYVNEYSVDGRFAARYAILPKTTLKGGVGTYHQLPDGPYIVEGYGNRDIGLEWAIQYSAGFEQYLSDLILLDVTGFYVDMRALAASNPELANNPDAPAYTNDGKGRSYGAEVLLKHEPSQYFTGWISYTLSRSERYYPVNEQWKLYPFDQTHILNAVGLFRLPDHWSVGFRFRLVSGIPMLVYKEDAGFDTKHNEYVPSFVGATEERLPMVHTLDIRVDKSFVYDWAIWTIYLDVQNVYNNRNAEFRQWNYDYSESAYVKGLPILPAIGMELEF